MVGTAAIFSCRKCCREISDTLLRPVRVTHESPRGGAGEHRSSRNACERRVAAEQLVPADAGEDDLLPLFRCGLARKPCVDAID